MEILLGTNNRGKVIEISEGLAGLDLELLTLKDVGITDDPEETGDTYEDNALIKALSFHSASGLPTIADDSGIVVEALAGELGVQTRRWGAGAHATDEEWITFFLDRMSKEDNKRAHFVCCLAYVDADGNEHLFEGKCSGEITETLEADYLPGLPISACFKPDGCDCVFSALSIEQKNSSSHRGRACEKLRIHFEDIEDTKDCEQRNNEPTKPAEEVFKEMNL